MLLRLVPPARLASIIRPIGLLALASSILWSRFAPSAMSSDLRDATQGFMLGIALALLIWSLALERRARR
jgi:hypothetical protein